MNTIKLTPDNVSQYIGREIRFKTRGNHIVKKYLVHLKQVKQYISTIQIYKIV